MYRFLPIQLSMAQMALAVSVCQRRRTLINQVFRLDLKVILETKFRIL